MTYQQTVDYLFTRLPMFSRTGADAYKADLTNTIALCDFLSNPQNDFKCIHIAGTNGKGSTSHMLAAILQEAGYKTGLYTSPHLKDFRERIKINGEMIPEDVVVDFTERTKDITEKIQPSFFELTVGMAFEYFAQQKVDIAIIETGLGGRLDSTNIITPLLSIITNIGYDHMNILGDTLEKIAAEKAGIIKPGIPVIIGAMLPEIKQVFETTAAEKNAPLYHAAELKQVTGWEYVQHKLKVDIVSPHSADMKSYLLDLPGIYQTKNLPAVLVAVELLHKEGFVITDTQLHKALAAVKHLTGLHGRWEMIQENPKVVLDVGHNEDGIKAILQQLELTNFHHLHMVTGMVKDKDVDAVLSLLPKHASYYFTQAAIPRALPAVELLQKAIEYGLNGEAFSEVNIALTAAKTAAAKDDLILVCGSVYLVGEVNRFFTD
jgi:dihydrofolate synthase / folylpolyglutamate synthase